MEDKIRKEDLLIQAGVIAGNLFPTDIVKRDKYIQIQYYMLSDDPAIRKKAIDLSIDLFNLDIDPANVSYDPSLNTAYDGNASLDKNNYEKVKIAPNSFIVNEHNANTFETLNSRRSVGRFVTIIAHEIEHSKQLTVENKLFLFQHDEGRIMLEVEAYNSTKLKSLSYGMTQAEYELEYNTPLNFMQAQILNINEKNKELLESPNYNFDCFYEQKSVGGWLTKNDGTQYWGLVSTSTLLDIYGNPIDHPPVYR